MTHKTYPNLNEVNLFKLKRSCPYNQPTEHIGFNTMKNHLNSSQYKYNS